MADNKIELLFDRIMRAATAVEKAGIKGPFDAALIFGSGLGAASQGMKAVAEISYGDVPGMSSTTLDFHRGRFIAGEVAGRRVVAMDGRFHRYEGFSMEQIVFPLRVMKMLGAKTLMLSNIAGGMNPQLRAGDICVMVDHINLMGDNPLIGVNDERIGPRYPDMMEPYSKRLINKAEQVAMKMGMRLPRAVYAAVTGPMFETPAEYRMLRGMGADLVGMSSVPEVIAARHMGMEVLALSLVSDECFPDCLAPLEVPVLLKRAEEGAGKIAELFRGVLEKLKAES